MKIKISEIFRSLQGESSYSGLPCLFIRLYDCNLRCDWCDSVYSFKGEFKTLSLDQLKEIIDKEIDFVDHVELTGGEPLLQKKAVIEISNYINQKYQKKVLLETNGSLSLAGLPKEIIKIVDFKLPDSGERDTFRRENYQLMHQKDEIKFVINSLRDYQTAALELKNIPQGILAIFSVTSSGSISLKEVADQIIKDKLMVKLQVQLHKIVWDDERGK